MIKDYWACQQTQFEIDKGVDHSSSLGPCWRKSRTFEGVEREHSCLWLRRANSGSFEQSSSQRQSTSTLMAWYSLIVGLFCHSVVLKIGSGLNVKCLFTPCHTTGHMCYYVTHKHNDLITPCVFTGDTLFLSGCGRFFEGSAEQMYHALITILSKLPNETVIFSFHFKSLELSWV